MTVGLHAADRGPGVQGDVLPTQDLGRPIRVVLFGGAFLEPAALEWLALLDEHPEVEFLGGFCESPGLTLRHAAADVVRRRRWLAPAVLALYAAEGARRFARTPRACLALRRRVRPALSRVAAVSSIHAPDVLERIRALAPDLGLVYGSPVLRPELFEIPAYGTIGIHHGRLPEYRGKKLTVWAMLNGDTSTGVTIQRIGRGIDTGAIVRTGEVPIRGRRYGAVEADVQALGVRLYLDAVLDVKRGEARCRPQPPGTFPLYRQPRARDILQVWWHGSGARPAVGRTTRARGGV
jgi:folate-dependent phosphoribosylglycinamide formyltransferase PurN